MAKVDLTIECSRYCIFLFPVATFKRIGEACVLTVFGMPVYKRIGDVSWLLGFTRQVK